MSLESEREEARETLKYRVVEGYNPRTRGVVRRPMIVDCETLNEEALVNYALKIGYVRGKSEDICGILRGLFQAMQVLGLQGKTIYIRDILRIRGVLTGTVDESGALTEKNAYRVRVDAFKDLKRRVSDFDWVRVDKPKK